MKIAFVYFTKSNTKKFNKIAEGFKKELAALGHDLEVIDGNKTQDKKLTPYKFVIIGAEAVSFFGGKLSQNLTRFISNAGMLSGKNSLAFVIKSTIFGTQKSLIRLMGALEHEGLLITSGEIINNREEAASIAKKIIFE